MGIIKEAFASAYRDFNMEGVSTSGRREPPKVELRALGGMLEQAVGNAGLGALVDVAYATNAELAGDLAHAADTIGLVYADGDDAKNDLWIKSGAPGAGAWTNTGALHNVIEGAAEPFVTAAELAAAAAAVSAAALAAPVRFSIWPDDRFAVSRGDRAATVDGKRLYSDYYTDAVWEPDFAHSRGKGAWKHGNGVGLFGIPVYFSGPAAAGAALGTGAKVSFGAIIKGVGAGNGLAAGLRFFATHDRDFITEVDIAFLTTNGNEQVLALNDKGIPDGAGGAMVYFYGTADPDFFRITDFWAIPATSAGVAPPAQMSPTVLNEAMANAGPLGEARGSIDWATLTTSQVGWSAASAPFTVTRKAAANRDLPFFGWAAAYATPVAIEFNAVKLSTLNRSRLSTALWRRIGVVVRTDADDASATGSTLVAIGSVTVDPNVAPLTDVVVPLRDPVTSALITLSEADLGGDLFVGYYALEADGTPAAISELTGLPSGIAHRQSYYIAAGDPTAPDVWSNFGGNPTMGIELALLDDITIGSNVLPTPALELALGVGGPLRSAPSPEALVMAPRAYGVVGRQTSAYFANLHSATGDYAYDVDGIGEQFEECWRLKPVAPVTNQALKTRMLTASRRGVLSEVQQRLDVVAANAPAGAARNIMAWGDSTTAAALWQARALANAAANPQSVQLTMIGTLGAGANKHEGRGGWTMQRYYAPVGADVAQNAFVTGEGQKFNMAEYLLATGQSAPDIVVPPLPINDVVGLTTDADVHGVMDLYLIQLDQIIGLDPAADVGSLKEANPDIATLIAVPIPAPATQDGMGFVAGVGQTNARYRRNITIAAHRIVEHYRGAEADKVFLVGWNAVLDPVHSFGRAVRLAHDGIPYAIVPTYAAAIADLTPAPGSLVYCTDADVWLVKVGAGETEEDIIGKGGWREAGDVDGVLRRINNDVHPNLAGYNQMGDGMTDAINVLVALGLV